MKRIFKTILFCALLLVPSLGEAADLKIFDSLGLSRAFAKVESPARIKVQLNGDKSKFPASFTITNLDGLSADKQVSRQADGAYEAIEIGPGSWKIILTTENLSVGSVQIIE